jgi:hypothetical protein
MTPYKGLEPKTKATMVRIINNVAKVIKTGNIELLSKQAYNYLYLCQGFIAHYNWAGFMDLLRRHRHPQSRHPPEP